MNYEESVRELETLNGEEVRRLLREHGNNLSNYLAEIPQESTTKYNADSVMNWLGY